MKDRIGINMSDERLAASASSAPIPLRDKTHELVRIFFKHFRGLLNRRAVEGYTTDVEDYDRQLLRYTGRGLKNAVVLEIGYGARPNRLFITHSFGADVTGIDLDAPLITGRLTEIIDIWRRNGLERVVKSVGRFGCFDLVEPGISCPDALRKRGIKLCFDRERLMVGDAADLVLAPESLDLVYSEDVFEHMPEQSLKRLLPNLASWIGRKGICLIRPNVFTGITGGHLTDWFSAADVDSVRRRRAEPWEHLRRKRFSPNTFLNGIKRARYRQLFLEHFEILEENVRYPDLGKSHLTPEVAKELAEFGEDELFSNQVQFVLKAR